MEKILAQRVSEENISVFISGCHEDEISSLEGFFRTKRYRKTFGNMGNRLDRYFHCTFIYRFSIYCILILQGFFLCRNIRSFFLALYNTKVF
jgi:hypothetical protein